MTHDFIDLALYLIIILHFECFVVQRLLHGSQHLDGTFPVMNSRIGDRRLH